VEGLNRVKVAATAICDTHTLVTDEDGIVWAFGGRMSAGLGDPEVDPNEDVKDIVCQPTPILALHVHAPKSPDMLPFR